MMDEYENIKDDPIEKESSIRSTMLQLKLNKGF